MCHVRNIERATELTEDLDARKMEAFQLNTKKSKQHKCDNKGAFIIYLEGGL